MEIQWIQGRSDLEMQLQNYGDLADETLKTQDREKWLNMLYDLQNNRSLLQVFLQDVLKAAIYHRYRCGSNLKVELLIRELGEFNIKATECFQLPDPLPLEDGIEIDSETALQRRELIEHKDKMIMEVEVEFQRIAALLSDTLPYFYAMDF